MLELYKRINLADIDKINSIRYNARTLRCPATYIPSVER